LSRGVGGGVDPTTGRGDTRPEMYVDDIVVKKKGEKMEYGQKMNKSGKERRIIRGN
jgi:hypothetical protein